MSKTAKTNTDTIVAKTNVSSNKPIIVKTVIVTLAVLALIGGVFYAGTQYQENQHTLIKNAATQLVHELK